jgi:hypothetical protein
MNTFRSWSLVIIVVLGMLMMPISGPVQTASASPVVVDSFLGSVDIANLTFEVDTLNNSLVLEIPRGATIIDASVTLEGVSGLLKNPKQLDFVNGVIGKNVWAKHEGDAGIYPLKVDPHNNKWTPANKKEYMSLDKNDGVWWITKTSLGAAGNPTEWPIQIFHFNPAIQNATELDVSWLGHSFNQLNQTDPAHAEMWLYNQTGTTWEKVDNYSSKQNNDVELNYSTTGSTPYISSNGSIDVAIVGAISQSMQGRFLDGQLDSDYIEVIVTPVPTIEWPYDITLEVGATNVTTIYTYLTGETTIDATDGLVQAIQDVIDGEAVHMGTLSIPFNFSVGNMTTAKVQVRDLRVEYEPVVNAPPVWEGLTEVEVTEDEPYTVVMDLDTSFSDDHNDDRLAFEVHSNSDPFNLSTRIGRDGANHTLEVQGMPDFFGDIELVVQATDMFGNSTVSAVITVHVLPTGDSPVIVDPGPFTVLEGEELAHTFGVDDVDLPEDEFTFSDDSEHLDVDPSTGSMSWTPDQTQVGPHRFLLTVIDSFGLTDTLNVNIMVTDVNQPPMITSSLEIDSVQGKTSMYTIRAEDPDVPFGDHLRFEAYADGIVLDVEAITGRITFVPTNDHVPSFDITLRVFDDALELDEAVLVVNVQNVNDPPVLEPMGPFEFDQHQEISVQLVATDPDMDLVLIIPETLTYQTTGPEEFAADASGLVQLVPDQSLVGTHSVVYMVIDGEGSRDSITVSWTIVDVNDAPVITLGSGEPLQATEDEEFSMIAVCLDEDGDTIQWEDDSPLFDIDPYIGSIKFTPTQEDVGEHTFTLTVSDGRGGSESSQFTIIVANVNDDPVIGTLAPADGTKYKEGAKVTLLGAATDVDGDTLTFTWKEGDTVLGTGETVIVEKLKKGEHTITLVVDDGTTTVSDDLVIIVTAKDEEPGFPALFALMAIVVALVVLGRRKD